MNNVNIYDLKITICTRTIDFSQCMFNLGVTQHKYIMCMCVDVCICGCADVCVYV